MAQVNNKISKLNILKEYVMKVMDYDLEQLAFEVGHRRFFPTNGPSYKPLDEFGIDLAGASTHNPPFEINRNRYPWHCAYITISGEGRYATGKGEGRLTPGEIWVVPALWPHRYRAENQWTYMWVHFRDKGYWRNWCGLEDFSMPSNCFDQLLQVANSLFEHSDRWGVDNIAEQWTRLFVLYLEREFIFRDESSRHWQITLSKVWREVRVDPARNWTSEELAHMAHMSHTHFNRVMQKTYGMSIRRMLAKIRLERALTLMRATTMKLDLIAELTGYSTSYALSKAFQREFGDSPRRVANKQMETEITKEGELHWSGLAPSLSEK